MNVRQKLQLYLYKGVTKGKGFGSPDGPLAPLGPLLLELSFSTDYQCFEFMYHIP